MIQLPPSKSIGARYLVATYFAGTLPADPLFEENDDLMVLQQALLEVYSDEEPIDFGDSPIDVGASGTALRFMTAVCASSPGADYIITGTPRLMQRPMLPLLNTLKEAGANVECLGDYNSGPYRVTGGNIEGGRFSMAGDISSQFISAAMLVAPAWKHGIHLSFTTPLTSVPYIRMTAGLMSKFGIKVELNDKEVKVKPGKYKIPENFVVEADWSSASFFYEACALGAPGCELEHLVSPEESLQGDAAACNLFSKLGVESVFDKSGAVLKLSATPQPTVEVDFKDFPDLFLPFAVACLCKDIKFRFTGVRNLRLKESDRIKSLHDEALKLGYMINVAEDLVEWNGEMTDAEAEPVIDPHDDHRVAMAFAMAALKRGKISIKKPEVVGKSFIDFWNSLPQIGLSCSLQGDIMTVSR